LCFLSLRDILYRIVHKEKGQKQAMGRPSDARQRLIEAAKNVFFSHSYEAVSVDELCTAAGVNKSSFYHFFASKQELVLAAIDSQWQWFEQNALTSTFSNHLPPHEQILHFFDLVLTRQQEQKRTDGYMHGCPAGNLTLEMSTRDELIRTRVARFFQDWLKYFEHMLDEAKKQGSVPATLDSASTAQALLAYFEGVMLLAKGRNDPSLIHTLRAGTLALMQYQGEFAG
jgi:TetR/AcrR family transcriptional repressor of nem operon